MSSRFIAYLPLANEYSPDGAAVIAAIKRLYSNVPMNVESRGNSANGAVLLAIDGTVSATVNKINYSIVSIIYVSAQIGCAMQSTGWRFPK